MRQRLVEGFDGDSLDEVLDRVNQFIKDKDFVDISFTNVPYSPEFMGRLMNVHWYVLVVYKNRKKDSD